MNALFAFALPFHEAVIERLGWVLVHSLWQIGLVALLAMLVVRLMWRSSAAARYGVLVVAMAGSIACPMFTWMLQRNNTPVPFPSPAVSAHGLDSGIATNPRRDADRLNGDPNLAGNGKLERPLPDRAVSLASSETQPSASPLTSDRHLTVTNWIERTRTILRPWLVWIVAGWGLGVLLCSLRPLLGWRTLRHLQRVGVSPVSGEVLAAMHRVSKQLGMRRAIRVLQSNLAQVPVVVGYLPPVILLPVSMLTSIPTPQLEAILAHELAHIRRHDFIVNLIQTLVETLFFYHPAIWWLSHQIRVEREHCCDDLVIASLGNRVEYGRALLAIEELRGKRSVLALAANDGSLISRIRRIAGLRSEYATNFPWSSLCLVTGCIAFILGLGICGLRGQSESEGDPSQTMMLVEWSVLVDESVLNEIRALNSNPLKSNTLTGIETIRCTADELRAIIKDRMSDKKMVTASDWVRYHRPTRDDFRPPDDRCGTSGSGLIPVADNIFPAVSWSGDGTLKIEERLNGIALKLDANYEFQLEGAMSAKALVNFGDALADGKATSFVLTPVGTTPKASGDWNPSAIFVYEAIRLPTNKVELLQQLTSSTDWIRRGSVGTKEHVARIVQWRSRLARDYFSLDEVWTRELPNGGRVQLVGLGRDQDAEMIWWTPNGEPLKLYGPNYGQSQPGSELSAIVRVWEADAIRVQRPPNTKSIHSGVLDDPERFLGGKGSHMVLVPVILDRFTGTASLKIGAGFGAWTSEATIRKEVDSSATLNGIDFRSASSGDLSLPNEIRSYVNCYWKPTSEFDFTAVAITQDGKAHSTLSEPILYANVPPNTLKSGRSFQFPVGNPEIQHFVLKSRICHWTEFTGFAIEPAVPLDPPLDFARANDKQEKSKPDKVTFQNVSLVPGMETEVKATVAALPPVDVEVKRTSKVFKGVVAQPNGLPAAKAQLAIASGGNEVTVRSGKLSYSFAIRGHERKIVETDEQGRFELPSEIDPSVLIAAHDAGYAEVVTVGPTAEQKARQSRSTVEPILQDNQAMTITLQPWGRIEGRVLAQGKPVVGAKFWVYQARADDMLVRAGEIVESNAEGRFIVERIPPGSHGVCQRYAQNDNGLGGAFMGGLMSRFDIPAGRTTTLQLGSPGRTVIGRLALPEGVVNKFDWTKVSLRVYLQGPRFGPSISGNDAAWQSLANFLQTEEGKLYVRDNVVTAADGSFRIEGMPAAEYILEVSVDGKRVLINRESENESSLKPKEFFVPSVAPPDDSEKIDLGEIRIIVATIALNGADDKPILAPQSQGVATELLIDPVSTISDQSETIDDAKVQSLNEPREMETRTELRAEELFARKVSISAQAIPLKAALAELARAAKVELKIELDALKQVGLNCDEPVTLSIKDEPLGGALGRLIKWQEHLVAMPVVRGGKLVITTLQADQAEVARFLPEWLKAHYNHGLVANLDDDHNVVSISAGEVMTDELLAKLKMLPKLRELDIGSTTQLTAGGLTHLAELSQIEKLTLSSINQSGDGLGDVALMQLVGLTALRELRLTECGTTDAGIRLLEGMPQLSHLTLYQEGRLTDAALASIGTLKQLKYLGLWSYGGTERLGKMQFSREATRSLAGLRDLKHLHLVGQGILPETLNHPKLQSLSLGGVDVNDDFSVRIAACRDLQSLSLNFTNITDDGMKSISELPALTRLELNSHIVTDVGIEHLKKLTNLEHISLRASQLSDKSLLHLAEIETLSRIDLTIAEMHGIQNVDDMLSIFANNGHRAKNVFTIKGVQQLKALPKLRTLWLTNFVAHGGYYGLHELTQLRVLTLDMSDISEAEIDRLEEAMPNTTIHASGGGGLVRLPRKQIVPAPATQQNTLKTE